MRPFHRCTRIFVLPLLGLAVFVPVILLSHGLKDTNYEVSKEFVEDLSITENGEGLKEPLLVVYIDNTSNSDGDKISVESRVSANGADLSVNNCLYCHCKFSYQIQYKGRYPEKATGGFAWDKGSVPYRHSSHNPDMLHMPRTLDEKLKEMKDQVIWAKAYLSFSPANSSLIL